MKEEHPESGREIICPNCGFPAVRNYCAQCGQPTHLHDETFLGMVAHFVGHWFHYDSKFWKTLKALWFHPGELTLAYIRKQRMRYIPPISLYIFISAVYFLASFTVSHYRKNTTGTFAIHSVRNAIDSLDRESPDSSARLKAHERGKSGIAFLDKGWEKLEKEHGERAAEYFTEQTRHNFPKIFFFLIPLVALMLKLLFLRRKDALFVHHAVFSLHIHSFFFSILLIDWLNPFTAIAPVLSVLTLVAGGVYFIAAIRKVYAVSIFRATMSTLFIGMGYMVCLALAIFAAALIIIAYV